jgi:hypothetical protein
MAMIAEGGGDVAWVICTPTGTPLGGENGVGGRETGQTCFRSFSRSWSNRRFGPLLRPRGSSARHAAADDLVDRLAVFERRRLPANAASALRNPHPQPTARTEQRPDDEGGGFGDLCILKR